MYSDGDRTVQPVGARTAGGAYAHYRVVNAREKRLVVLGEITFQNAPVDDVGVRGFTNEALLAVVIDRLEAFQAGQFPCDQNATALDLCKSALQVLEERTGKRKAVDVETVEEVEQPN